MSMSAGDDAGDDGDDGFGGDADGGSAMGAGSMLLSALSSMGQGDANAAPAVDPNEPLKLIAQPTKVEKIDIVWAARGTTAQPLRRAKISLLLKEICAALLFAVRLVCVVLCRTTRVSRRKWMFVRCSCRSGSS